MDRIDWALVLNLHQPAGNLARLLDADPWAAAEILYALDRIPRSLWADEEIARLHLSMSGTLLETLADPSFQHRAYGTVDCGSLLWYLQNTQIIDILGSAYYHAVLPLIPPEDRPEQLRRWRGIGAHLFHRTNFTGFWPPEMAFTHQLIPLLHTLGYRYVLVDSAHVEPITPMSWEQLRYRPHLARHDGAEIVVVVRDRELSDAQESGMDADWFLAEVRARTQYCDFTPLVTTCTDGDNGGWYRNSTPGSNFWTAFHADLLGRVRRNEASGVRPVFIRDHLTEHPPYGEVRICEAAWNTGWHNGVGFTQWTGSAAQRAALAQIAATSSRIHKALAHATPESRSTLDTALTHLLRAQTSCNLYWGEAWVSHCLDDLNEAERLVDTASRR